MERLGLVSPADLVVMQKRVENAQDVSLFSLRRRHCKTHVHVLFKNIIQGSEYTYMCVLLTIHYNFFFSDQLF